MADPAARIRTLIAEVVPAVCLECLAGLTFLSERSALETAAALIQAGHLVVAEDLCEACAIRRVVFRVTGAGANWGLAHDQQ
jgi:hypothetical protein